MSQETSIQLFENAKIRVIWDDEQEKYFFSVVDVVGVLTEQETARNSTIYWAVVKKRLKSEGADELITNCKQLKLPAADGKKYLTDVADLEQILRIVQSIPSKKAEPLKRWLAQVGSERIQQMIDPEYSSDRGRQGRRTSVWRRHQTMTFSMRNNRSSSMNEIRTRCE